jgi:thiol-disulfide isomerase/thioredoxin
MIKIKTITLCIAIVLQKYSIAQSRIEIKVNQYSNHLMMYNSSLFSKDAPVDFKNSPKVYNFQNILPTTFVLKTADYRQIPYLFSVGGKYTLQQDNKQFVFSDNVTGQKKNNTNIIAEALRGYKQNPLLFAKRDTVYFSTIQLCLENYKKRVDSFYMIYNQLKSEYRNQSFIKSDNYITASTDFTTLQYLYSYISKEKGQYSMQVLDRMLKEIYNRLERNESFEFMETILTGHLYLKIQLFLTNKEVTLNNEYILIDSIFKNKEIVYLLKFLLLNSLEQYSKDDFNLSISQLNFNEIPLTVKPLFNSLLLLKKSISTELLDLNGRQSKIDTIYKFKHKLVYIDTWASWCKPCVEEFQFSETFFKYYDTAKFQIIYLSLDKDINSWKKAISLYKLPLNNSFLTVNNFNSEFAKNFNITSIPRYILIGKHGKVISADAPRPSDPKLKTLIDKYINQ